MRIKAILFKEWQEALHNKLLIYTSFTPPLVLIVIMAVLLRQLTRFSEGQIPDDIIAHISGQFTLFFLLIPVIIPTAMASYSIIGEKTSRSLEPLLATPVTVAEIMLGKGLAAALPAVAETWLAYALTIGLARALAGPEAMALLTGPGFYMPVLLLAPLMATVGVLVIMIVSSRVNDPRAAQQIGVLVIIPVFALFSAQIMGRLEMTPLVVGAIFVALVSVSLVLLRIAVRLFQRETILTRWK